MGVGFIDALALFMLTIPIFYPTTLDLGYDPIRFGIIIVMVWQMDIITPPVGINSFVVIGIAKGVPLETVFKMTIPLLPALIVGATFMIAFPESVTWLPNLMF